MFDTLPQCAYSRVLSPNEASAASHTRITLEPRRMSSGDESALPEIGLTSQDLHLQQRLSRANDRFRVTHANHEPVVSRRLEAHLERVLRPQHTRIATYSFSLYRTLLQIGPINVFHSLYSECNTLP